MEEIFSPAHWSTWAAIVFSAGGSYFLLRSTDRTVKEHAKVLGELALTTKEISTLLRRCIEDLRDLAKDTDMLKESTAEHHAWSGAKHAATDESINGIVQRLSRIEGKIFNGKVGN